MRFFLIDQIDEIPLRLVISDQRDFCTVPKYRFGMGINLHIVFILNGDNTASGQFSNTTCSPMVLP